MILQCLITCLPTNTIVTGDHGDRFLNEFTEFIQKPVPMILKKTIFYVKMMAE